MVDAVVSPAEQLEKAVEAAGFVHPLDAPKAAVAAVVPAVEPEPELTAKERVAQIAAELVKASPSGVETLASELAGLVEKL